MKQIKIVAANFQNELLEIKRCCLKHQKCARALKEGGVGTRSFIFLSGKLSFCHTFVMACVTVRTNFVKCFAVRAVGNALQPLIYVISDQQLNLRQVSNKAASSVDKENC